MSISVDEAINNALEPFFLRKGISFEDFSKSESLITSGIIDSMAFVNLLLELETELSVALDFDSVDMADIVTISGLYNLFNQNSDVV